MSQPRPETATERTRHTPFFDPALSYEANYERGPFGLFAEAQGNVVGTDRAANSTRINAQSGTSGTQGETHSGTQSDTQSDTQSGTSPGHSGSFLGLPVALPFGIPAGPLLNGRFVKAALDFGFDLPVYKTVRSRFWPSHAWPNVLAVDARGDLDAKENRLRGHSDFTAEALSITNSFGVPSMAPQVWQPDMAEAAAYAKPGQVVIGSFQGTLPEHGGMADYIADFVLTARLVRETGVKIAEVNLSCPNEGTANLLCFDVGRATAVIDAIRNELGPVKLLAKIAFFADDEHLQRLLAGIGPLVDGIAAINTIPAEVVDESGAQSLPGEGRLRSGVCGSGIRWAGLAMTGRIARLRDEMGLRFAVVGVGGVGEAADYSRYVSAGADAVMSATGAMWNPLLARHIKAAMGNAQPQHAGVQHAGIPEASDAA